MNIPDRKTTREQWDRYIPTWLQQMLTIREVVRQTLASDYDSTTAPFRADIKTLMREANIGALKALTMSLTAMQATDPLHVTAPLQNVVIAAGLDLAETEDDILGKGSSFDPDKAVILSGGQSGGQN